MILNLELILAKTNKFRLHQKVRRIIGFFTNMSIGPHLAYLLNIEKKDSSVCSPTDIPVHYHRTDSLLKHMTYDLAYLERRVVV